MGAVFEEEKPLDVSVEETLLVHRSRNPPLSRREGPADGTVTDIQQRRYPVWVSTRQHQSLTYALPAVVLNLFPAKRFP